MPNKKIFSDSSIVPAGGTTSVVPYQPNQMNTAMMLAAADPATRQRISKEVLSNQCRMLLAYSAMENVLMVSLLEVHCCQMAPAGMPRYKAIADAYTAGAANRIMRY